MKKKVLYLAMVLISGAVTLNSCGNKSSNNSTNPITTTTKPVDAASASIASFAFTPATINLNLNGTVTWTNKDATAHTVTDVDGSFDSNNLAVDATYSHKFTTAGTYTYYCKYHSMMAKATVIVK